MNQVPPLFLFSITAEIDQFTVFGDQDGPTGPPRKSRAVHTVRYVAPSQSLALAHYREVHGILKPEIKPVEVVKIDAVIHVTRCFSS